MDVLPVKAYYKHEGPAPVFDIAGVVGVMGPKIQGSFTLCMEKAVFLRIMSRMLNQECTDLSLEIEDGAAELVNIIFGQAKRVLNEVGYSIQMAIPTLVKGKSVTSNYFSKNPVIILPFSSSDGQFWIEFTYE
jgi:chemotaxis protein CheX